MFWSEKKDVDYKNTRRCRLTFCAIWLSSAQKLLCEKLEEQLHNLDSALKKKERAERR